MNPALHEQSQLCSNVMTNILTLIIYEFIFNFQLFRINSVNFKRINSYLSLT